MDLHDIYTIFNLTHIIKVYIFFRGNLLDGDYGVGDESADAGLFSADEIPWDELAFPTIQETLRFYLQDREHGEFPVRTRDIEPMKKD